MHTTWELVKVLYPVEQSLYTAICWDYPLIGCFVLLWNVYFIWKCVFSLIAYIIHTFSLVTGSFLIICSCMYVTSLRSFTVEFISLTWKNIIECYNTGMRNVLLYSCYCSQYRRVMEEYFFGNLLLLSVFIFSCKYACKNVYCVVHVLFPSFFIFY